MTQTNGKRSSLVGVIIASSLGTTIEFYDFFIFGSVATIIASTFFPSADTTASLLSTLGTFAVGFVVRPYGGILFGRLGDMIGRKYTFIITLLLMGVSTAAIGIIPGYDTIGLLAPILVFLMRVIQGLAMGGEYGGAASYVAEHSEKHNKGYLTSWVQTAGTVGFILSLIAVMGTREALGTAAFNSWGWRIPFVLSILLVIISYYIRQGMSESPLFQKIKDEGKTSKNPLKESFGNVLNLKYVLLGTLGGLVGIGVIWYTAEFYTLFFLKASMNIDSAQVDVLMTIALTLGTPFFMVFGWLSDKIGRKPVILTGMLLGVLSFQYIYQQMYDTTDISKKKEITEKTVIKSTKVADVQNNKDTIITTSMSKEYVDGTKYDEVKKETKYADASKKPVLDVKKIIKINERDKWMLIFLVFIMMIYATMCYGPMAVFLVELFPTKIRYTSISLPVNLGAMVGGLMPSISTYLVSTAKAAGDPQWYLQGLWYPIILGAFSFVVGLIYIDKKMLRHHH